MVAAPLREVMLAPAETTDLDSILRERFGLASFRPWQREAIEAILRGAHGSRGAHAALVIAPTGGGKSLVYQLPAVVLGGTTLVLSPLVALMEDQVRALESKGIPATFLASTLDLDERRRREAAAARGDYKILYAAPERLGSDAFLRLLASLHIPLVAIDEAHCISQWGHDFRPDYLRIGPLLERLRPPRIVACTATATPAVRREIAASLGFDRAPYLEVLRGFARPNLHLEARAVDGPKEARSTLFEALARCLGAPGVPRGAAIVYAATRRTTEEYAALLREKGWNAAAYHAGLHGDVRSDVATRFASGSLNIVVATNAFGMGIDRSDIRLVLHVQPPSSIEAYYQEVGRAGRDGEDAHGVLLCSGSDIALRRRLIQGDSAASDPALTARAWELFRDLLKYLDARSCRHDFVLRYFGDERETLGGCGHCDVCETLDDAAASPESEAVVSLVVRKALSGLARADGRAGLGAVVEMLRGVDGARTRKFGFTALSTFGILREHTEPWLLALMRAMLAAGWIDLTPTEHPVPFLSRSGVAVMRGTLPARIALPPKTTGSRRPAERSPRAPSPGVPLDASLVPVFERLRAHRAEVARERRVPAYVVALDRTLADLATRRPTSREELASVFGMGPQRIEQYGAGFLSVLADC